MRTRWCVTLAVVASACSPRPASVKSQVPGDAAIAAARPVTVDTPATDSDGNTVTVPAGWRYATVAPVTMLLTPEDGARIALVDVAAPSAEAARDAAWRLYTRAPIRPVASVVDRAESSGWSRWKSFRLRTTPNEARTVSMSARFAHGRWLVIIHDAADAVFEKRSAQFALLRDIAARGYTPESFAGKPARPLDAAKLAQLRAFIERAMQLTGTPGVAYGLIQDGAVVWSGGVGVREVGKPAPVDAKTLFLIASNTKMLTTLMLAKLVDQHALAWDTPVTQVLPSFQLGSPEVTREVEIQHLICACTGLPRQDLEWYMAPKTATAASTLHLLAESVPTTKFGELFQYSNLMAAAAGYVGGHAVHPELELGAAYDRAMQDLVFDPLGMASTTFDTARALRGNHAAPYGVDVDGHTVALAMDENDVFHPVRPAGGAWSNVEDLLEYVAMELGDGALPGGGRYIAAEPLLARRKPGVTIGSDEAYGMGVAISTRYDVTVYNHGGDLFGYRSNVLWIPAAHTGAVILINSDRGAQLRDLFTRKLLELLYDGRPEVDARLAAETKAEADQHAARRKTLTIPGDPAEAAKLAPRYRNAQLGELRVERTGGKLVLHYGAYQSEAASRRNADGTVSFIPISAGYPVELDGGGSTLTVHDDQHAYVFTAE